MSLLDSVQNQPSLLRLIYNKLRDFHSSSFWNILVDFDNSCNLWLISSCIALWPQFRFSSERLVHGRKSFSLIPYRGTLNTLKNVTESFLLEMYTTSKLTSQFRWYTHCFMVSWSFVRSFLPSQRKWKLDSENNKNNEPLFSSAFQPSKLLRSHFFRTFLVLFSRSTTSLALIPNSRLCKWDLLLYMIS